MVFNLIRRFAPGGGLFFGEGPAFDLIFSSNEERFGGSGATAYNPTAQLDVISRGPELLVLKAKV